MHLVGGPRTIETYRALGALDELRVLVLPLFGRAGRRLTPDMNGDATLSFMEAHPWPNGVVELSFRVEPADMSVE
jgi:hypothetical protein